MAGCLLVSPLGSSIPPSGMSSLLRDLNVCYNPLVSPRLYDPTAVCFLDPVRGSVASSGDSVAFSSGELCAAPVSLFKAGEPKKLGLIERRGKSLVGLSVKAMYTATTIDTEQRCRDAASPKTLYQVLGVPKNATDKDIRSAYRLLARRHHPDVVTQEQKEASTKNFIQIHAAYGTLSDSCSRATYDLQLSISAFRSTGYADRHFSNFKNYYSNTNAASSNAYCSPRSSFSSRGRSWETDQCWC